MMNHISTRTKVFLSDLLKWPLVVVAVVALHCASMANADAGFSRRFLLKDHPSGNENPPPYGLRLDGLFGGSSSDIWTFSFEEGGSVMFLDQHEFGDGSMEIHIHGTAYGGKVDTDPDPHEWFDPQQVTIDFRYTTNITYTGTDNEAVVSEHDSNSGTIIVNHPTSGVPTTINLIDHNSSDGISFEFKSDGHRLPDTTSWVGRGWLNHSGRPHITASDWLFTIDEVQGASPIPEPASILLLTLGGLGLLAYRRRQMLLSTAV